MGIHFRLHLREHAGSIKGGNFQLSTRRKFTVEITKTQLGSHMCNPAQTLQSWRYQVLGGSWKSHDTVDIVDWNTYAYAMYSVRICDTSSTHHTL